jgi:PAS domain S-box-containing protein
MLRKKSSPDRLKSTMSPPTEEKFRMLIEAAPIAISILQDPDKFLYVNKFWETLTGYSAAETEKLCPVDIVLHQKRKITRTGIEKILNGGTALINQELQLVRKDGKNLWVEFSARLIDLNQKKAVLTFSNDITERKLAEFASKSGQNEARQHLQNINFLAETALHFVNNTFDGNIYQYLGECLHRLNPGGYFIINSVDMVHRFTRTEAIVGVEQHFRKILSILGFDPIGEYYTLNDSIYSLAPGTIRKFEYGLHELSFNKIPLPIARNIERFLRIESIYGIAFILDNQIYANAALIFPKGKDLQNWATIETFVKQAAIALKRQQAETALKESEAKFRTLAEMAPTAICIIESPEKCLYVNKFWETLTGYSGVEAKQIRPIDLVRPEIHSEILESTRLVFQGILPPGGAELELIRKDHQSRWVSFHAQLIDYEGEKAILVAATDITGRKNAEVKIQHLLNEKEILLREVHHRIKNNMSSIESLLSLQLRRVQLPETISALQDATSRIKSMGVLYEKLYRSANFNEISIKDYLLTLINEVIWLFPNQASVKIQQKINDFIIDARVSFPLGIIINELLTNSMKHAFKNQTKNRITVTANCKNQHATITIQDNGVGIPESVDFTNSTGFGLQLVTLLTEQIDGQLRLERGKGTKVIIEFKAF